jgi:membrane protein DedA with SNARE-associated domain
MLGTMTIDLIIERFGVLGVFLGAGVEGETVAVAGGLLAHRGLIPLWAAAAAAACGSFVADQLLYFAGRHFSDHPRLAPIKRKPAFAKAILALDRHPTGFIFAFRFLYGLRTVSPIVIGIAGVPPSRFILINAIAAAIWGPLFTCVGYAFGTGIEQAFGRLRPEIHLLAVAACAGLAAFVAFHIGRWSWRALHREGTCSGQ